MKRVLIIGGAGKIGSSLLNKMISENYEIGVLDLKSNVGEKRLSKFQNKIKITYGDISDKNLILDLTKQYDVIINCAGIMPPFANLNEEIAEEINFNGVKNICDAIKEVNNECLFIDLSFISIYGNTDNVVRKLKIETESNNPDDLYSISLIRSENYIKDRLSKFIIYRLPIVLTDNNYFLNHSKMNRVVDFITIEDLVNILILSINNAKLYGKVFNLSGFKANTTVFVNELYKCTGKLNLANRTIYYGEFDKTQELDKYIKYTYHTLDEYFNDIKKSTKKINRRFNKVMNAFKYFIFKRFYKKK